MSVENVLSGFFCATVFIYLREREFYGSQLDDA
jgi:hypothetical protein